MLIHVINGPNLNLLGSRQPEIYGTGTLADIEKDLQDRGTKAGAEVLCFQSNDEGELVTLIQNAAKTADAVILNAAAYSHTSIALHDAIAAIEVPVVEVHLSNIFARETFRRHSFISDVAAGVICGFGARGYALALDAVLSIISSDN